MARSPSTSGRNERSSGAVPASLPDGRNRSVLAVTGYPAGEASASPRRVDLEFVSFTGADRSLESENDAVSSLTT